MGQYKLTTRGRIVLFLLAIILISLIIYIPRLGKDANASTDTSTNIDLNTNDEVITNDNNQNSENDIEAGSDSNKVDEDIVVDDTAPDADMNDTTNQDSTNQTNTNGNIDDFSATDEILLMNSAFSIYFKPNKFELTESDMTSLDEFISVAKDFKDIEINIESFSMSSAISTNNDDSYEICEKRSEAVKNYMLNNGISESRIKVMNYGDSRPISETKDADSAWLNMRSDIFFEGYKSYK